MSYQTNQNASDSGFSTTTNLTAGEVFQTDVPQYQHVTACYNITLHL